MKNILKQIIGLAFIAIVSGCATAPKLTSLEIQAFQKKTFDANKKIAFGATVSVFQDIGYTIKSADVETGFIQASSPAKNVVFFGSHTSLTEASAFIEEILEKTSIRLNFVDSVESSSAYGMKGKAETPNLNAEIYNNAFTKIQEAIFIRQGNAPEPKKPTVPEDK
jgi:hypothetical protein